VYTVVTTRAIAGDMARYEDNTFEELGFVGLGTIRPITDEDEATRLVYACFDGDTDTTLRFRFRFTGEPETERWLSFGVRVETEEVDK